MKKITTLKPPKNGTNIRVVAGIVLPNHFGKCFAITGITIKKTILKIEQSGIKEKRTVSENVIRKNLH